MLKQIRIKLPALLWVLSFILLTSLSFANNATAVYRSNTGSGLSFPKIMEWNSAGSGSWGSGLELATAGSSVREAIIKYSPVSPKRVIVTQSDDGYLDAYVSFDGVDWEVTNDIGRVWTSAPSTHSRRFDIAFESATGDTVLVYSVVSTNTSCDIAYKVLPANASNFSGISEQCIDDTTETGDVQYSWISAASDPVSSSEEIIIVGFDSTRNDVNAFVWDGKAWGNQQQVTAAATATGGYEAIAVAYAADGSKAMVVSGDRTSGNIATYYWGGTSWTNSADFIGPTNSRDVRWITLKEDPSTDDMTAVFVDNTVRFGTAYWNGSAWTVLQNLDGGAAIDSGSTRPVDFAWDPTGSTGRVVFDTDGDGVKLRTIACNPQCNGTPTDFFSYAAAGRWISLYTNPTAADAVNFLGVRLNSNNDIGSFSWNGTGFANYGVAILTTDTSVSTFEASSLDFQRAFDTIAPSYSDLAQSNSTLYQGDTNYLTAVWTDNVQLKTAKLETNETGVWENKTTYGSPLSLKGNYSLVNFSWSNSSVSAGTVIGWRIWASDRSNNWAVTSTMNFTIIPKIYNFTVTPSSDSFSVQNDTYIDRNYTLINTGNQPLSITCSDNATWVFNITACPLSFNVNSSVNVTFRFNATERPIGIDYVFLNFTDPYVSRNVTVNVTITEKDTISPIINSVSDTPDPVPQNGTVTISANITDNYGVNSAKVQINNTNYSMVQISSDIWQYNYTASLPYDTYTYTVYANDTSNNNATPVSSNFTVSSIIYPTVTTDSVSYTMCSAVYYKISVFDVNDQPVDAHISNSLKSPLNETIPLINTSTGNGGTGIYLGLFYIHSNYSTTGQWDLESLSGYVKGQTTFSISS